MWWILLIAVLHLVGSAVPWGREEKTFRQRLSEPFSVLAGVFVVSAALPIIGTIGFIVGIPIEIAVRLFSD